MDRTGRLVLIVAASTVLLFVGLWQIEMMMVQQAWNYPNMSLPFGATAKWWFARDLWYSCILAAFGILIWVLLRARRIQV